MAEILNIFQQVIEDAGGYNMFNRRMDGGRRINSTNLRNMAAGKIAPTLSTRQMIVDASQGRLTHADIIAICGDGLINTGAKFRVDPGWDLEPDHRREWIAKRAARAAREARKAAPSP